MRGVIHLAHPKRLEVSISFQVEVDLLKDVLSLEGDNAGLMFELSDGVVELGLGAAPQDSLGIPSPVENLGSLSHGLKRFPAIYHVIQKLYIASAWDLDLAAFNDLNLLLGGSTSFGSHQVSVGVDQVLFAAQLEHSFICGLQLEVAIPGSGFGVLDVKCTLAGLSKVGHEDLTSFAVPWPA